MSEQIELSNEAKSLKLGLYEHYKGHRYQLLGPAINSETLEELVLYQELSGDKKIWVRPLKMFLENVEVNGKTVPRFTFISEKG